MILQGKDREEFADFYNYATERGTLFYDPPGRSSTSRPHWVCTGADHLSRRRRACSARSRCFAQRRRPTTDAFLTTTAPASLEPYRGNEYYKSRGGIRLRPRRRDAHRVRDDRRGRVSSCRSTTPGCRRCGTASASHMGLAAFRKYCMLRVEALNHALRNVPEDRIRYHLCWGSWHGPHAYDIELRRHAST